MKFHLICQGESANVKKLLGIKKKKKSWEMWEKALSNYSLYLGPLWLDIYIIVMEVQAVIKLVRWVSSLFQDLSTLFVKEKKGICGQSHFSLWWNCHEAAEQGAASVSHCFFIA